jgi:hypothetical protein
MILLQGRPPLPPMPPTFCERFPDDPSCVTNVPTDSGIEIMLVIGLILGIYSIKKKLLQHG